MKGDSLVAGSDDVRLNPALTEHHRRCVSALATLLVLSRGEDGEPLPAGTAARMTDAVTLILDELRGARKHVVEELAETGGERFTSCTNTATLAGAQAAWPSSAGTLKTRSVLAVTAGVE